jgi:hypothetical protein
VKPLRPWVGDETDDQTDEAIFLVRRRYPETNQCSNQAKIDQFSGRRAYTMPSDNDV